MQLLQKEVVDSEYFQIQVKAHPALGLNTYHAKYAVIDGQSVWLSSGDLIDKKMKLFDTAITLKSEQLARRIFSEASDRWNKHVTEPKNKIHIASMQSAELKDPNISLLIKNSTAFPIAKLAPVKFRLLSLIQQAKKSITIITPNLNDPDILLAISQAAARGCVIKIMMGKHNNQVIERLSGGTNLACIETLMAQTAREHHKNIDIRWSVNPETKEIIKYGDPYDIHSKFAVIDDDKLIMGSTPLDRQGLTNSFEIDCEIQRIDDKLRQQYKEKVVDKLTARTRNYFVDKLIEQLDGIDVRYEWNATAFYALRTKLLAPEMNIESAKYHLLQAVCRGVLSMPLSNKLIKLVENFEHHVDTKAKKSAEKGIYTLKVKIEKIIIELCSQPENKGKDNKKVKMHLLSRLNKINETINKKNFEEDWPSLRSEIIKDNDLITLLKESKPKPESFTQNFLNFITTLSWISARYKWQSQSHNELIHNLSANSSVSTDGNSTDERSDSNSVMRKK